MVDWTQPTITTVYTTVLTEISDRINESAILFDGTTSTNIPIGAIRLDTSDLNKLERWNGTIWENLNLAITGTLRIFSTAPRFRWEESDAGLDQKIWDLFADIEALRGRIFDDAQSFSYEWLNISRSGTGAAIAVDTIDLVSTTDITLITGTIITTANYLTTNAQIQVNPTGAAAQLYLNSNVAAQILLSDTGSTATNRNFGIITDAGQMVFYLFDDTFSTSASWLTVNRSGNTATSINFTGTSIVLAGSNTISSGSQLRLGAAGINPEIGHTNLDRAVLLCGGQGQGVAADRGGNIVVFGSTHATKPNVTEIRSGATTLVEIDNLNIYLGDTSAGARNIYLDAAAATDYYLRFRQNSVEQAYIAYVNSASAIQINRGGTNIMSWHTDRTRALLHAGFDQSTLTDGVNISWNLQTNQSAIVTLAGNRTLDNPTNQKAGFTYILVVKQDAIGGRTLAFGTAYVHPGGDPVIDPAVNAVSVLSYVSDGTNMYGVMQAGFS